jgi:hypothetical protein
LNLQALLLEILLAAFFAIACFKARPDHAADFRVAPRRLFILTDRIERLRRTRLQWCSIALLLILVRTQFGEPIVAELTALAQFVLFMMLPVATPARKGAVAR